MARAMSREPTRRQPCLTQLLCASNCQKQSPAPRACQGSLRGRTLSACLNTCEPLLQSSSFYSHLHLRRRATRSIGNLPFLPPLPFYTLQDLKNCIFHWGHSGYLLIIIVRVHKVADIKWDSTHHIHHPLIPCRS